MHALLVIEEIELHVRRNHCMFVGTMNLTECPNLYYHNINFI